MSLLKINLQYQLCNLDCWFQFKVPVDKDVLLEIRGASIDMRERRMLELPDGKHLFSVVLKERIPDKADLLQNYPNPCNPETWIPYQLSEDSLVSIRIYDVSGRLVRELNLGHKDAGMYYGREQAAYWDGRNTADEYVASGVYFYQIQAGRFSKIRKMTLLR